MARWRLTAAHYLYTEPPTEYTHIEVSRETGRQYRQTMKVPRLLEPKDPGDHNYPNDIIVCDGNNPQRFDIIFLGEPTADMEPIDDEARAITKKFVDSGKWRKPEDGMDYGETLIRQFLAQMEKMQSIPQPVSVSGIDPKSFADLQDQVKALMEQNAKLQAQILEKPSRRLV